MSIIKSTIHGTVKIWHPETVNIYDSKIGEKTKIGSFVEIGRCKIGSGCVISSFCFLCEGVTVEDNVFLGPRVTTTNVMFPRAFIDQKDNFKPTIISHGATIGAGTVIVCGIKIGEFAFIGSNSTVTKDVMPYSMVYGNPAKHAGWICEYGHKLGRRMEPCSICGEKK